MKKIFVFIIMLSSFLYAQEMYVSSRLCPVFDNTDMANRVTTLQQNDQVYIIETFKDFYKIEQGYVSKIFLSDTTGIERVSRADEINTLAVSRRRAYAYQTSAAAARGLTTDNIRDRENVSFKNYDFDSIKWLESLIITDEELYDFIDSQFY